METKYVALLFLSPLIGVLIFATAYKYIEVRRARSWKATHGRVVRSAAVQRAVRKMKDTAARKEIRNFASVAYDYEVGGRRYTGNRVSIGEDLGNCDVAETIARYPVGKLVTVYFDPGAPERAVLERDLPAGSFRIISAFIAGLALLAVGAVFGIDALASRVSAVISRPASAPMVVALGMFALFLFLFARVARAEGAAAAKWPWTEGEIVHSDFDTYRVWGNSEGPVPVKVTVHSPRIIYAYSVAGVPYKSERVRLGVYTHSTVKSLVGRDVRALRVGQKIKVYYDPANPSEAILDRSDWRVGFLYAIAATFAVAAAWVAWST